MTSTGDIADQIEPAVAAKLTEFATAVRAHSRTIGATSVGCAVRASDGSFYVGCNVEHSYRSHDVHAEVNAISAMVAGGSVELTHVLVVSNRTRFSPCGACLDWIFEFGGPGCIVGWQGGDGRVEYHTASELMPFHPH